MGGGGDGVVPTRSEIEEYIVSASHAELLTTLDENDLAALVTEYAQFEAERVAKQEQAVMMARAHLLSACKAQHVSYMEDALVYARTVVGLDDGDPFVAKTVCLLGAILQSQRGIVVRVA